jgi:hypothetical protein
LIATSPLLDDRRELERLGQQRAQDFAALFDVARQQIDPGGQ